ncbi:MAG: hypothetical protein ACKO4T_13720 [Planctomycetaceae bacterium]
MPFHAIPLLAVAIVGVAVATAFQPAAAEEPAQDRVRLLDGSEIRGEITDMSPNSLTLETKDGSSSVSIEAVREVRFGGEPDGLRDARTLVLRRDGTAALAELETIDADELREADAEIRDDVSFVKAAATALQALATGTDLARGQKLAADFVAAHPRSVHLYAMQELLGDLLAAQGRPVDAARAYDALAGGPPAVAVRAATRKADLQFREGRFAEAQRGYEAAAKAAAGIKGKAGLRSVRQADLGRARCLISQERAADAVAAVSAILAGDDADAATLGGVFNVLGAAQRALPGHEQDALIAFLTVDLVHNEVAEDHAEALFNLVELWEQVNFPERAREARQALETTYPQSPWTKRLRPAKAS